MGGESKARRVAIVGFWDVTRDLAYTDPRWATAEHWSLNHNHPYLPNPEAWDVWFDPHTPEWSAAHMKPEVWADQERFLKESHGKPVFMQRHYEAYPDSVALPLEEMVARFGRRYFTCAVTYMVAYALHVGVQAIGLFGADMRGEEEYATQRPATEYWLGRAEGMGVEVYVPPASGVLNPGGLDYGYDEEAGTWVEVYKALATRRTEVVGIREVALLQAAKAEGRGELARELLALEGPAIAPALKAAHEKAGQDNALAMAQHYGHEGIRQELDLWLERVAQRRRGGGAL